MGQVTSLLEDGSSAGGWGYVSSGRENPGPRRVVPRGSLESEPPYFRPSRHPYRPSNRPSAPERDLSRLRPVSGHGP